MAQSGLPLTNLRATQFHDGFILFMVQEMAKLPVVRVPAGLRFQPIDVGEVAARLVEAPAGPPTGQVPDIAGPAVAPTCAGGSRNVFVRLPRRQ